MPIDDKLEFDEEGFHYFVDSNDIWNAEGYEFISSAYVSEDDFEDRMLYVELKEAYLSDFESEAAARQLDERLKEVEGIEDVYWEDRELLNITYKEGQSIPELVKRIDAKVTELSHSEE